MKTLGIIGGLSPESTIVYYKALNDGVRLATERQHQAKIVIVSVDGSKIWASRQKNDWEGQGKVIADAGLALERTGVDFILLAANTMHKMAESVEAVVKVPFLHLIDTAAKRIVAAGIKKVGLTGTSYTMTDGFYHQRLAKHGIETIVPEKDEIQAMDSIIYSELCVGSVKPESQQRYEKIVNKLGSQGAEGIILGCTELTLFTPLNCPKPLFDTTQIHIEEALKMMLD